MTRAAFAFLLLLACSIPARAATLSLAWNASTDVVQGYRVLYGVEPGEFPLVVDVGNQTTASLTINTPGRYHFAVIAYAGSLTSGLSNVVVATIDPPADTSCDFPLGSKAVSMVVTRLQTSNLGGSKARLDFQVASPGSPLLRVAVRSNGQDLRAMKGDALTSAQIDDLAGLAGMWFTVPLVTGTYPLSVFAQNAYGCTREQMTTYSLAVK